MDYQTGEMSSEMRNAIIIKKYHDLQVIYTDDLCFWTTDCTDQYANCINHQCQCKENYVRQGKKCYGRVYAECTEDSQCLGTRLICQNGTCSAPDEEKVGENLCFDKSGARVCYGPKIPKGSPHVICRIHGEGFTVTGVLIKIVNGPTTCRYMWSNQVQMHGKYELLQSNENIKWKNSNFTLDKAVYGGFDEFNRPTLLCKTKNPSTYSTKNKNQDIYSIGRLSVPYFDECQYLYNGIVHRSKIFDTLIYEA
ncbi:hypothetical protein KQX54_014925 [Cotesia glomerata]|uniref:EB domain-containing protein n=1 Tax=Cotesia glomerata TaxID=32391 RepID=A0AAV7IVW8_COTGL|nr:hypothetical protein KQX54_014925 [Cotesia glomerata]